MVKNCKFLFLNMIASIALLYKAELETEILKMRYLDILTVFVQIETSWLSVCYIRERDLKYKHFSTIVSPPIH